MHPLPPLFGDALVDLKGTNGKPTAVSQITTSGGKDDKRYFGPNMTLQQLSMQMSLSLGAL